MGTLGPADTTGAVLNCAFMAYQIRSAEAKRRTLYLALLVAVTILVILIAACGDDDESADTTTTSSADSTTTTAAETTTTGQTTTTETTTTETTLPGQPIDGFASEGDVLGVMGVAHDDVLNIREAPGTDQTVVATAEPTADDVVATGNARELPNSIWYEVTVDGTTGWASAAFLGFIGATDDATAEFLDGGPPPVAETMVDLAAVVTDGFASEDPESLVVQSVAPTVGDLGEITYDVIGIGDDAIAGFRLHIFGSPNDDGESFTLRSIERTTFCTRGLDGELCT